MKGKLLYNKIIAFTIVRSIAIKLMRIMTFRENIKKMCASLTVIISIHHRVSKCNFYLDKVSVFIMFIYLDSDF